MSVAERHKELRFTRAGQAVAFWIGAAILFAAALTLLATNLYRADNPQLPHPLWAILPLVLSWLLARIGLRCARHAYLILTPLGVEIFPLFRPETSMNLVSWSEISAAETDSAVRRLTLHFNSDKTAGIHLSLRPIRSTRRQLLVTAIQGRLAK